jgi:pimeloyl-ACP methyl ester carboxylesterase
MDKYYRKVPADLAEQFKQFRLEHPLKHTELNGLSWEYIQSGDPSGQPVLLLPGGLSTAESAWRLNTLLEPKKYHLICPSYPPQMDSMTQLADGIGEILKQEGIKTAYVVGGAYGSMVAQVFIHRHPDLVTRLVLTHAYPPVPNRIRTVDTTLRLFRRLPMFMVRNMLRIQMTGRLSANPPAELLLIAAQIRETLDTHLTRQAAINIYLRMVDFDRQEFTFTDLENWQGKTLIILAEDDPTTTETLRNELLALYPGASMHMLKGSIQTTALLETGEYERVMEEFFEGKLTSPQ